MSSNATQLVCISHPELSCVVGLDSGAALPSRLRCFNFGRGRMRLHLTRVSKQLNIQCHNCIVTIFRAADVCNCIRSTRELTTGWPSARERIVLIIFSPIEFGTLFGQWNVVFLPSFRKITSRFRWFSSGRLSGHRSQITLAGLLCDGWVSFPRGEVDFHCRLLYCGLQCRHQPQIA